MTNTEQRDGPSGLTIKEFAREYLPEGFESLSLADRSRRIEDYMKRGHESMTERGRGSSVPLVGKKDDTFILGLSAMGDSVEALAALLYEEVQLERIGISNPTYALARAAIAERYKLGEQLAVDQARAEHLGEVVDPEEVESLQNKRSRYKDLLIRLRKNVPTAQGNLVE